MFFLQIKLLEGRIFNILPLIFFIVILSSCQTKDSLVKFEKVDQINYRIPNLQEVSEFEIFYAPVFGETCLSILDKKTKRIVIADYLTNTIVDTIQLLDVFNYRGGAGIASYQIVSADSIFVLLDQDVNILFLLNHDGVISRQWSLPLTKANGYRYGLFAVDSECPIIVKDSNVVIQQQFISNDYLKNSLAFNLKFKSATDLVYNLYTGEFVESCTFPRNFIENFYYEVNPCRTVNTQGEIIYSFGICDSLYVHNLHGQRKRTILAESIVKREFLPFDKEQDGNYEVLQKYWSEQFRYKNIWYDEYRDLYYRLCVHPQTYINDDGTLNLYNDKSWSLVILNNDFKKIGENFFEGRKYNLGSLIITKGGILLGKYRTNESSPTEFDFFEIQRL